jgi:hypothetical protein
MVCTPGTNEPSHAFRHTVIMSMLRDAKIDPAVVATIAGNTPRTIYSNYSSQVSIDEQRRAENAFDRVGFFFSQCHKYPLFLSGLLRGFSFAYQGKSPKIKKA